MKSIYVNNAAHTDTKDEVIKAVGVPSTARYNALLASAVNETKLGGDLARAQVFATLALAEAQYLTD